MTSGTDDRRTVDLHQIGEHRFRASNGRGGSVSMGVGEDPDFTPVELLLAAVAGCGALDVDYITGKRAAATEFTAHAAGVKVRDEQGSRLAELTVTFTIGFPASEAGDRAREVLPAAVQRSQDRLCTVARTIAAGEPATFTLG
jgi:putative redox protein